jgi:hypothetical protein
MPANGTERPAERHAELDSASSKRRVSQAKLTKHVLMRNTQQIR